MLRKFSVALACLLFVAAPAEGGTVTPVVEAALLAQESDAVILELDDADSLHPGAVERRVLCVVTEIVGRHSESDEWHRSASGDDDLLAWSAWTVDFLQRNPKHPVALLLAAANVYPASQYELGSRGSRD